MNQPTLTEPLTLDKFRQSFETVQGFTHPTEPMAIHISPELSTPVTPKYKHEELRDALMMACDYLERCDMPYVLWGKTLKHVMNKEEELTGDTQIELGIRRAEVIPMRMSVLDHWARSVVVTPDTVEFKCNNIPVVMTILDSDEALLLHPDIVNYWIESFKVPNPYSEYVKKYA